MEVWSWRTSACKISTSLEISVDSVGSEMYLCSITLSRMICGACATTGVPGAWADSPGDRVVPMLPPPSLRILEGICGMMFRGADCTYRSTASSCMRGVSTPAQARNCAPVTRRQCLQRGLEVCLVHLELVWRFRLLARSSERLGSVDTC